MPQQTKIFRVFVSSTFTDMQEERSILQKNVFPKLEKYCEENGARFQAVDLRWGVNEESQLNQKTLEICLNEIARCQKISPKPNFLVLLGGKYGWQPIPEKIPSEEMEKILEKNPQNELIEKWYQEDTNAIPPEYVLQPRDNEYRDYLVWSKTENEIRTTFRDAVDGLSFSEEQRLKYFTSATHQEIMAGALNPVNVKEDPATHVFAMLRKTEGLPSDKTAAGFIDFAEDKPDEYCKVRMSELKQQLKKKLDGHCIDYQVKWDGSKTGMKDPASFESTIYHFLEGIIQEQMSEVVSPDEIDQEVRLHDEFRTKLTENFLGREEVLQKLGDQLKNNSERRILALIGDSGSGKTSVMAKLVQESERINKNTVIVHRFIGTTSRSSNIISLLHSVCAQVARELGTTLEALAGEGREKALYDVNGLTEILKKCLALGTPEKPILLLLDALDQLSDADNAKSLYWLPRELPPNTKIVVSALPELKPQLSNHQIIDLPLLPKEEAARILDRWLNAIKRTLTPDQKEEILGKFGKTGLPIYLKLAFEKAKKWNSYTPKAEYTLKEDVNGIINNFIDLLEGDHTHEFVRDVICLMLCGRYQGLAENEILEIFAFDEVLWKEFLERTNKDQREDLNTMKAELEKDKKAMKIPIIVWSRLYLDLEPYLTERDADGVPIITFFHRQFNEVLRERFGLVEIDKVN